MNILQKPEFDRKIESGHAWPDKSGFLREYYTSLKEKRDGLAWFFGLISPWIVVVLAYHQYMQIKWQASSRIASAFLAYELFYTGVVLVVRLAFFLGQRWA